MIEDGIIKGVKISKRKKYIVLWIILAALVFGILLNGIIGYIQYYNWQTDILDLCEDYYTHHYERPIHYYSEVGVSPEDLKEYNRSDKLDYFVYPVFTERTGYVSRNLLFHITEDALYWNMVEAHNWPSGLSTKYAFRFKNPFSFFAEYTFGLSLIEYKTCAFSSSPAAIQFFVQFCFLVITLGYAIVVSAMFITYRRQKKQSIIVSNDNVYYDSGYKKKSVIHISKITNIAYGSNNSVVISSPSERIKVTFLNNKSEIINTLVELVKRSDTQTQLPVENEDEKKAEIIKKYKELLDCGAITQEEFDAKKANILN